MVAPKVFVSHAGEQKFTIVDHIRSRMGQRLPNVDVFCDDWSLMPGENALLKIRHEAENCDIGLVILSEEYMLKSLPMEELGYMIEAHHRGTVKFLVPVLYGITYQEVVDAWDEYWNAMQTFQPRPKDALPSNWHGNVGRLMEFTAIRSDEVRGDAALVDRVVDAVSMLLVDIGVQLEHDTHSKSGSPAMVDFAVHGSNMGSVSPSDVLDTIRRMRLAAKHGELPELEATLTEEQVPAGAAQLSRLLLTTVQGTTVLHLAAQNGDKQAVHMLLQAAADADSDAASSADGSKQSTSEALVLAVDGSGQTALHYSCQAGRLDITQLLLDPAIGLPQQRYVDLLAVSSMKETPLHAAARCGQLKTVEYLLDNSECLLFAEPFSTTPLHSAASNGHVEVVNKLLEYLHQQPASTVEAYMLKASTQGGLAPGQGQSALHMAVDRGHPAVVTALLQSALKCYDRSLLVLQDSTKLQDCLCYKLVVQRQGNRSTLDIAASSQAEEWEKLAITSSILTWQQDLGFMLTDLDMLSALLPGSDPGSFGELLAALVDGKQWGVLSLLIDLVTKASVRHPVGAGTREFVLAKLVGSRIEGSRLLNQACSLGHTGTVKMLVWAARDSIAGRRWLVSRDAGGRTAWHHAAKGGHMRVLKLLVDYDRYLMFAPRERAPSHEYWKSTPAALLGESGEAAEWWKAESADETKFHRAKQMISDASGGILVGSAVIAGVAFSAVYNPPRGWSADESSAAASPGSSVTSPAPAAAGYFRTHPGGLLHFYWLNGLSLYCALISIILGAGMSLPQPSRWPREELRSMVRWVFYTTVALLLALLFNAAAFAAAMLANVQPGAQLRKHMSGMLSMGILGAAICIAVVVWRLLKLLVSADLIGKDTTWAEVLLGATVDKGLSWLAGRLAGWFKLCCRCCFKQPPQQAATSPRGSTQAAPLSRRGSTQAAHLSRGGSAQGVGHV